MPRKGFVKIKMLENHGGFTVGDIREVKSEAAEILIADTPATRNEKRIPPKALLLTPEHPHYEDVPGPDAPPPPIVQVVQAPPAPVARPSIVAPAKGDEFERLRQSAQAEIDRIKASAQTEIDRLNAELASRPAVAPPTEDEDASDKKGKNGKGK